MIEPDPRQRILATIPRGDAQLPLILHRAPGSEPRDLVVHLHGMAEDEVDPDSPMPRIFTDLGMDVLRFNYAGLHGIPGVHTPSSGLDDVQAILDALDAGAIDTDLKPARTVLVGYSFGSGVALLSAAADPRVDAVADDVFPAEAHFVPLYRALVQASHARMEADLLPTDHAFAGIDVPGLLRRVATWIAADRA